MRIPQWAWAIGMAIFVIVLGTAFTAGYSVLAATRGNQSQLGQHDVRIDHLEKAVGKIDGKLDTILDEIRKRN